MSVRGAWLLLLAGCDLVFPIDSKPPFDAEQCPAGYTSIAGLASRYHWTSPNDNQPWTAHEAECEADSAAGGPATHVVVYEDENERLLVTRAVESALNENYLFTGIYRDTDTQMTWSSILGETIAIAGDDWAPFEPMPQGGPSVVYISFDLDSAPGDYATDPLTDTANAVCECDGREVVQRPQ